MNTEKTSSLPLWSILFLAFALSVILRQHFNELHEEKFLTPPPEHIEYFHFGFRESLADSFWLRWIQDNDYCQTYGVGSQVLPESLANEDRLIRNPRHRVCDNSWAFKMLDAITRLAPRFKMPYVAGAITLSVLIEDFPGASIIFDRAVAAYPEDWVIAYRAAYHFLYDRKDLPKAASLLQAAAAHGAPNWVASLAARLYSRGGQLEMGLRALESYRESLNNPKAIEEVDARIAELKQKLTQAGKEP